MNNPQFTPQGTDYSSLTEEQKIVDSILLKIYHLESTLFLNLSTALHKYFSKAIKKTRQK